MRYASHRIWPLPVGVLLVLAGVGLAQPMEGDGQQVERRFEAVADEAVARQRRQIEQARERATDASLSQQRRQAAFEEALAAFRGLIDDHPENVRRPIWRTELAKMLLIDGLQNRRTDALAFYEFGVPSRSQKEAYEKRVPEAYRMAVEAEADLFSVKRRLPSQSDEEALSGALRYRLFTEFGGRRIPFYRASAAYYTSLLPAEAPCFRQERNWTDLEPADDPSAERERLSREVSEQLAPFLEGEQGSEAIQAHARSLHGRALLHRGKPDEAQAALRAARDQADGDRLDLLTALAQVQARHRQGKRDEAYQELERLKQHSLAQADVRYRLLVVDLHHRLLREAAPEEDAEAQAAAYDPYLQFLESGQLGDDPESLRHYLYRRWARQVSPNADLSRLPPVVRLAVARTYRIEGQNEILAAREEGEATDRTQAMNKLKQAVRAGETLRGGDVPRSVQAPGLYNLALAQYWQAPRDVQNLVAVGEELTGLARRMPDQAIAEKAMGDALDVLRTAHQQGGETARNAYQRAAQATFEHFPFSQMAADERVPYASTVLEPAGHYRRAAVQYDQVPQGHPRYYEARWRRLLALTQAHEATEAEGSETLRDLILAAVGEARAEAREISEEGRDGTSPEKVFAAAELAEAEVLVGQGELEQAAEKLDGFGERHPEAPGLARRAREKLIMLHLRRGEVETAATEAQELLASHPDTGPAVLEEVLDRVEEEVQQKREALSEAVGEAERETAEAQVREHARTAAQLAKALLQWAEDEEMSAERRLPFALSLARAQRLSGDLKAALEQLEKLRQRHPHEAEVIHEHAETLFQQGGEEALVKAAQAYDKLIAGLRGRERDLYWHAWMRRLQINDRLGRHTKDIPRRVRQLKSRGDGELGGQPYREVLEGLAEKHSRSN